MQVDLVFIVYGETGFGALDVLGVFDTIGGCLDYVEGGGFQHGNPFVNFSIKPTILNHAEYGGDTLSLAWNDGAETWVRV